MTLIEFINHIKHKSLSICVYGSLHQGVYDLLVDTNIGEYLHLICRKNLDNCVIDHILCMDNLLEIYLVY